VNRDDLLNVDDKNWNTIVCRRCGSVIFPEDRVKYIGLALRIPKRTLLCGDCAFGPLGLRTMDDKEFWVAVERVRYVDKPRTNPKARPKKAKKQKN
ncbi:unnamed protein product, partial [Strongylus vulgaris]